MKKMRLLLLIVAMLFASAAIKAQNYSDSVLRLTTWGNDSIDKSKMFTYGYGYEIALYIPNEGNKRGVIKSIQFYIPDFGYPSERFNAKIYGVNKKTNGPGKRLLDSNLLVSSPTGGVWLVLNILDYVIPLPIDGFFISMEWLPASKKDKYGRIFFFCKRHGEGQPLGITKYKGEARTWIRDTAGNWKQQINPLLNAAIRADVLVR